MNIDDVWSWPAAIAAAGAGLAYAAFFVASFLSLRGKVGVARRNAGRGYALIVGVNVLVGTFMFTVSQAIAAVYVGDPFWYRAASRYGMWIPFAAALALVIGYVVRRKNGVKA